MRNSVFFKILFVVCISVLLLCTFTACKDKDVFAGDSDFDSYPDYWNDFNSKGDIFIPDAVNGNTNSDKNGSNADGDKVNSDEDGDYTANFTDDDDDLTINSKSDKNDSKDNNSSKDNDSKDNTTDNSSSGSDNDNNVSSKTDNTNQGPFVPFN